MHIKKSLPHKFYTKMDNSIIVDKELSDGAFRLYSLLASLPNGKVITDAYIMKVTEWSQRTVTNRKRELKDKGLILLVQIAPRVHDLYLGYNNLTAEQVKRYWDEGFEDEL